MIRSSAPWTRITGLVHVSTRKVLSFCIPHELYVHNLRINEIGSAFESSQYRLGANDKSIQGLLIPDGGLSFLPSHTMT